MFLELVFAAWTAVAGGGGDARQSQDPPAPDGPTYVVEIHGELNVAIQARVTRALREAQSHPGSLVILSLDTPGGEVTTMGEIGDAVRKASRGEKGVRTVAFVSGGPWGGAFSAGSFLALACDAIYMAKGTSIGGALPVVPAMTPNGFGLAAADDLAEGKITATLAARFRNYAEQTGRPQGIAAAFVDPMLGVFLVRLPSGAEQVLDAKEIERLRDQKQTVERVREIQANNSGRPLVLTSDVAFEVGFIDGQVESLEQLVTTLGREHTALETLASSPGEQFVKWIDRGTPILILLGIILGFLEAKIPGFGLAGILSTLCFALVFYGRYLLGAAEWLEAILFLLGLALIAVELFVVPGTLYSGVLGGVLMALSLFLSFQSFLIPRDAIDVNVLVHNLVWGSGIFLAAVVCMVGISRYLPKSPLMGRLALAPPTGVEGSASGAAAERALVGRVATALTDLRPVGIVEVDGRRVDAMTEGSYISRGTAVRVTEVDGNRVVVEAVANGNPA